MNTEHFNALGQVIEYLYYDEYKHYQESSDEDRKNHIFNEVKLLHEYITRGIDSDGELKKCKYCGKPSGSTDPDVLCKQCREDFGHAFFSEL